MRHLSRDQPHNKTVVRPTQMQATQGKWAGIRAAASLTVSTTSDEDKNDHADAREMEDSSDREPVTSMLEDLPHVTPQTAEDIL
ncbi:hypothetical protein NDU88_011609 [Pleurodeles waltl]|uniref:Uncharacterized protein n=1 Tax=Pleurodeles waltl TaxID=8319 RepID=A0AAV7S2S4_PLEWA|nr:hypothetical protein NDU88_011609 [Pleurodeles waltl]